MIRIVHLLDDFGMGGVTRALSLFEDVRIAARARSTLVPLGQSMIAPRLVAELIVLHVPPRWSRIPFLAALRLRNPGARIVQVEHSYTAGFERTRVRSQGRFRALIRASSRLVDEVVAVSNGQAAWLLDVGIAPRKLSTILPWSGRFDLLDIAERGERQGPLKLLSYGRFAPEKNFGAMVAAVQRFPADKVQLVLFGAGPQGEALARQAAATSNVTVLPPDSNPGPYLGRCDAVVLPSRHEAFGLVATEARLAGRAVLVADVDGLPEQAAAGGGLAMPLGTADEIADGIDRLLAADLPAMGRAARRGVLDQHDRIVQGWLDLIDRAQTKAKIAAHAAPFVQQG